MPIDWIIAGAAVIQGVFTIVLVVVYIRRQTEIMREQNSWNRTMWYSSQYPGTKSEMEQARSKSRMEYDNFHNEQHTELEIQQFDMDWKTNRLSLLQFDTGFIGMRKYLESQGARYGKMMVKEYKNDTNFHSELIGELLDLDYSEELANIAWEQFLSSFSKDDA